MGAAGDLGTDQSGLGVKHVGIHPLQIVPAVVIIAVAGGGGKAGGTDPIFLHSPDHLGLIVFCYLIDFGKTILQPGNDFLTVGVDCRGNPHGFIQFQ